MGEKPNMAQKTHSVKYTNIIVDCINILSYTIMVYETRHIKANYYGT